MSAPSGGSVTEAVRAHLLAHFQGEPSVASVTFLGLEAMDVLRFAPADGSDLVHYVSLGTSRYPMNDPAAIVSDPVRGPRAELVLTVRGGFGPASKIERTMAVLAASPAVEGVVLTDDGLIDLGQSLWVDSPFSAVLLGPDALAPLVLPEPMDPVHFLAVTPITATEAAWVRLRGAAALREAWAQAGVDVLDPARRAVNPSQG